MKPKERPNRVTKLILHNFKKYFANSLFRIITQPEWLPHGFGYGKFPSLKIKGRSMTRQEKANSKKKKRGEPCL